MRYLKSKGELIKAVVFQFYNWQDLVMTQEEYEGYGGYRKLIKYFCIPPGELKKKHHILLNPKDFPTEEWSG